MKGTANDHLLTILRDHAVNAPQRIALTGAGGGSRSYGALWADITALAAALEGKGLQRGDRAMLYMDGTPLTIAAHFALMHLGLLTLLLDPALPEPVVREQVNRLQPELAILPEPCLAGVTVLAEPPAWILSAAALEELLQSGRNRPAIPIRATADDPVLLMNTTGTTGQPKRVLLTLANISAATAHINGFTGMNDGDLEVLTLPLYHSFGLGRLRCLLAAGASARVVAGRFRPEILLKTVRDHRATVFAQVPMGMQLLLRFGRRIQSYLQTVRLVEIGSAPLALEHKKQLLAFLPGAKICHHYGLTEASRSLFIDYGQAVKSASLESMGRAAPGVTVRLLSEDGEEAEEGEIVVRGAHVSPGYYQGGTVQPQPPRDDFFPTGDLARRDERGFFHYLGRADDVINLGGFKVQPLEVEQALLEAFPEMAEAAVVGRPVDGTMTVIAHLVWRGPMPLEEKTIRERLRERLEVYKIPALFKRVEKLPRSGSGKLLRAKIE